jgi:cation diffusion facilitator family transporter
MSREAVSREALSMRADSPVLRAKRTAAAAVGITVLLAAAKAIVGCMTDSTALLADALHSATDLLALGASWFGLALASRKPTERFPYGFYRAETLAALLASGIILFLGGRFFLEGIARLTVLPSLKRPYLALTTAALSAVAILALSVWERRVSKATGSQSLKATADEATVDVASSALVFVAILVARYHIPYVEGAVTILISGVVLWAGLRNARGALLSLMDASVDPDLEADITDLLDEMAGVRRVEKIRARRSGPFYFVEGHIHVAGSMDVTRSHTLSHEAQRLIREKRPEVEGVILHVEPYRPLRSRVLIPIKRPEGTASEIESHFGRSGWFLLAHIGPDGEVDGTTERNPFQDKEIRAGLAVINRFVKEKRLDAVFVREIGEIAYHALRDNYVEIFLAPEGTVENATRAYREGHLEYLPRPTHSSEEKLETGGNMATEGQNESVQASDVEERLRGVIDGETGLDIMRMGLVRDLRIEGGRVELTFRPTSPVCPMAFKIASDIREAVLSVPGVTDMDLRVKNYDRAAELEALLRD